MLRARIITALLLLPLVFGGIYLLALPHFALLFGVIVLLGAWEWSALGGLDRPLARGGYVVLLALAMGALWQMPAAHEGVLGLGSLVWLMAIALVIVYPSGRRWLSGPSVLLQGIVLLMAAWLALVTIRAQANGAHWLVWLFLLVWGADIGGYFAGRRFGRRKLAPAVSPGKTWAGAVGGLGLAALVTLAPLAWLGRPVLAWLPLVVALVVLSIFGDLYESALKRQRGVKDSGTLLPGHGGVLDRVDALLAALPAFAWLTARGLLPA
ncbi:MAG: phosphatidate cytidylyltransferase [Gammaproteobacteria bacterium]